MMIFEHVWASFAFVAIHFLPVNLFQITVLVTAITPFKYKTQSYLPKLASQSNYSQNTEYKKKKSNLQILSSNWMYDSTNALNFAEKTLTVATNDSSLPPLAQHLICHRC